MHALRDSDLSCSRPSPMTPAPLWSPSRPGLAPARVTCTPPLPAGSERGSVFFSAPEKCAHLRAGSSLIAACEQADEGAESSSTRPPLRRLYNPFYSEQKSVIRLCSLTPSTGNRFDLIINLFSSCKPTAIPPSVSTSPSLPLSLSAMCLSRLTEGCRATTC